MDEVIDQVYTLSSLRSPQQKKKRKVSHLSPIVFARLRTKLGYDPKPVSIRVLLDSGASASLINEKWVKRLRVRDKSTTKWRTAAGPIETTSKCRIQFSLPELSPTRLVTWPVHVDINDRIPYDMIIGRDLRSELGIMLDFSHHTIHWDDAEIPMHHIDDTHEDAYHLAQIDSPAVNDATDRIKRLLDAKYKPADLQEIVNECQHLNTEEKLKLYELLNKYKDLFDGTLGHWKILATM